VAGDVIEVAVAVALLLCGGSGGGQNGVIVAFRGCWHGVGGRCCWHGAGVVFLALIGGVVLKALASFVVAWWSAFS
jgi:hypothetical protein